MIQILQHDISEWTRCAAHLRATGRDDRTEYAVINDAIHAYVAGSQLPAAEFDDIQSIYRAWLCFDEPKQAHLDESQIEWKVEKTTDRIDKRFMDGKLSQEEYDKEMSILNKWANQQFDNIGTDQSTHNSKYY